ncbi:MAG: type II toxin-antitoxin system RelE/ParE family toxin [Promethearchaeota archaeon]|nr:MAG: type II toxin-antitoxin system RelE/ParE family toxin [Candidatus Lokiarchaeota archaeon]
MTSKSSPQYARTFFNNIHNAVENIINFPQMGRMVPESDLSDDREILIQKYRVIYKYIKDEDKVLIKVIIHGSRLLKL